MSGGDAVRDLAELLIFQFNKVYVVRCGLPTRRLHCALSQLACYLFYRWNIVKEPHPTFRRQQDRYMYRIRVPKGQDPRKPISHMVVYRIPRLQLKETNDACAATGVCSAKKTRADQCRRGPDSAGRRWNHDALARCSLSDFVPPRSPGLASGARR
jgi:Centromere DNA-binding protein complex CBF3 subunit, domain 2